MTDFEVAETRVFEDSEIDPRSRFVDLDQPQVRIHLTEMGDEASDDVPVLFVHGSGFFGAVFAPLMAQLEGTRMIAFDRPGYGLSGDFTYTAQNFRQTGVDVLGGILDELGIDQVDLVGHSAGGYWSIVFALAHPERVRRLILIGGVVAFPGTDPPFLPRLFSVPVLNRVLVRLQDSSEDSVLEQFEMFNERDTIQEYPSMIRAILAQDLDPRSDEVVLSEFKLALTLRGWRSSVRLREHELTDIPQPTLVIWGENDPSGGPEDVRRYVESISDARLETVDAGHFPWFGHPERCAELIHDVRERRDSST